MWAQVVFEWDLPRENNTLPLEKIRHHICDGDMKNAITEVLSDGMIDGFNITVDQQYADVYEVEEEKNGKN